MLGSEAEAIHGIWFKPGLHHVRVKPFALPLLIAFPLAGAIIIVIQTKKKCAHGEIAEGVERWLASSVYTLVGLAYSCIFTLVEFAFS